MVRPQSCCGLSRESESYIPARSRTRFLGCPSIILLTMLNYVGSTVSVAVTLKRLVILGIIKNQIPVRWRIQYRSQVGIRAFISILSLFIVTQMFEHNLYFHASQSRERVIIPEVRDVYFSV